MNNNNPYAYADSRLSKYSPLKRILFFDDFDEGINGWCTLMDNRNFL